jgi:hypothetical protein
LAILYVKKVRIEWERESSGEVRLSSFAKLCGKAPSLKIFNFCYKAQKLLRYISRDSGGSPDSNYTKYINYAYKIREKIPIIFP